MKHYCFRCHKERSFSYISYDGWDYLIYGCDHPRCLALIRVPTYYKSIKIFLNRIFKL